MVDGMEAGELWGASPVRIQLLELELLLFFSLGDWDTHNHHGIWPRPKPTLSLSGGSIGLLAIQCLSLSRVLISLLL